jgi:hypothetical protein
MLGRTGAKVVIGSSVCGWSLDSLGDHTAPLGLLTGKAPPKGAPPPEIDLSKEPGNPIKILTPVSLCDLLVSSSQLPTSVEVHLLVCSQHSPWLSESSWFTALVPLPMNSHHVNIPLCMSMPQALSQELNLTHARVYIHDESEMASSQVPPLKVDMHVLVWP